MIKNNWMPDKMASYVRMSPHGTWGDLMKKTDYPKGTLITDQDDVRMICSDMKVSSEGILVAFITDEGDFYVSHSMPDPNNKVHWIGHMTKG